MRFDELNWMDVERYLETDSRLILVLGATEQHGYLSLLTDIKIPLALADAASQKTGVLVAPPLNFGCSPYFLDYPGTISLRISTLAAAVEDIISSVYRQGFQRILILNGHGGNSPARAHLADVNNALPKLRLHWYDWWTSHSLEAVFQKYQIRPSHANWQEAFPFTLVSEMPKVEKTPPYVPSNIMDAATSREVYGDGQFGGPYQVDQAIMNEIFDVSLMDVLHLLKFD